MPFVANEMTPAYYATYQPGHHGTRDRIGGVPSHLPPQYPACAKCDEPLVFIMQLYVDDKDLFDDRWLALQLYKCDPCCEHLLIAVDKGARLNTQHEGVPMSQIEWQTSSMGVPYSRVDWGGYVQWQGILWERREDPHPTHEIDQFYTDDGETLRPEFAHLGDDKLGGCFPWCDEGGTSAKELGAIGQFSQLAATAYLYNHPHRGLYFHYF